MEADPDVFVAGEDVGRTGGVFHSFDGLVDDFGEERMVDTPISEQAIIGLGIGAAVVGLRPVVDLMFMDFVLVAMDQIANQAAKLQVHVRRQRVAADDHHHHGRCRPVRTAPSTARAWRRCSATSPGSRCVMPSTPHDAKGLLIAAVRDDNPVVVVLHKRMLGRKGPVPTDPYEVPIGSAAITRAGRDVTLVAYSQMAVEALAAAETLAAEGIECEVIDLRSVAPMDLGTVLDSVRRTNRVVVVHEAVRSGGLGAEIAAQIQEHAFDHLDAPVARVGAPFAPVPFSPALEAAYVPNADRIAAEIRGTLDRTDPGLAG